MYIRTQDKKRLIPIENMVFTVTPHGEIYATHDIVSTQGRELITRPMVARYKTEEKAIKVLDEIQRAVALYETLKVSVTGISNVGTETMEEDISVKYIMDTLNKSIVYQMPEYE